MRARSWIAGIASVFGCAAATACGGGGYGGGGGGHGPSSALFVSSLSGANETTVADASARASAALELLGDSSVAWTIAMASPAVNSVTLAHVHQGATGVSSGVFFDLGAASGTVDGTAGTLTGSATPSLAQITRVL